MNPQQTSSWLLPVLLACASLTVMAGATIAPGLPGLVTHFQEYPNADFLTRLILTVPGLAIAISAPVSGLIADKLGRRVLLHIGIVLYIVSGSAGLWLDDLILLLASRFILGLAVGMIMVCSMALMIDHYHGSERERVLGIQSSAMAAGGILFIAAGSLLADVSWRAPFAIYLLPLLLLPLVYIHVSKPPEVHQEHNAIGEQFPIVHGALIYLLAFLSMLLFYFIPSQLPFLAIERGADSLRVAGFAVVFSQIFSALTAMNFGRVKRYLSHWHILLLSFLLFFVGFVCLAVSNTLFMIYFSMPFIGIGLGLNFPNLSIWLMSRVPALMRGRASGGLTMSVFLGQFASPFLSQPVIERYSLSACFLVAAIITMSLVIVPVLVGQGSRRLLLRSEL